MALMNYTVTQQNFLEEYKNLYLLSDRVIDDAVFQGARRSGRTEVLMPFLFNLLHATPLTVVLWTDSQRTFTRFEIFFQAHFDETFAITGNDSGIFLLDNGSKLSININSTHLQSPTEMDEILNDITILDGINERITHTKGVYLYV
jgi:hypothetical protein